jgi:hypothetical protein
MCRTATVDTRDGGCRWQRPSFFIAVVIDHVLRTRVRTRSA